MIDPTDIKLDCPEKAAWIAACGERYAAALWLGDHPQAAMRRDVQMRYRAVCDRAEQAFMEFETAVWPHRLRWLMEPTLARREIEFKRQEHIDRIMDGIEK